MIQVTNIRGARINEDNHTYVDENGISARFSISTIAQRGASVPDMKHIKAAAKVGTKIHALLHKIIQDSLDEESGIDFNKCIQRAQSTVLSPQESQICCHYIQMLISFNFKNPRVISEQSLIADFNGIPVGGTADLIVLDDKDTYIIDFKTAKMNGFKKEYHLQLYGYSLFRPEATNFKCYVLHPEGIRPLFTNPIPEWIITEFEDNFNYMFTKEQPRLKIQLRPDAIETIKSIAEDINNHRIAKAQLSSQIHNLEKQEKECIDKISYIMGDIFHLYDNFDTADGVISYEKVKIRRHNISYSPEIERYYNCSIAEEYHLTIDGKKVKIKIKGDENE